MCQYSMAKTAKEKNNYISLTEATKFCNYSQEYLSLRARAGKLKAVKLGRNWATTEEWIQDYIAKVELYKEDFEQKKTSGISKARAKNAVRVNTLEISRPIAKVPIPAAETRPPQNLPVQQFEVSYSFPEIEGEKENAGMPTPVRFGMAAALLFFLIAATVISVKDSGDVTYTLNHEVTQFARRFDLESSRLVAAVQKNVSSYIYRDAPRFELFSQDMETIFSSFADILYRSTKKVHVIVNTLPPISSFDYTFPSTSVVISQVFVFAEGFDVSLQEYARGIASFIQEVVHDIGEGREFAVSGMGYELRGYANRNALQGGIGDVVDGFFNAIGKNLENAIEVLSR